MFGLNLWARPYLPPHLGATMPPGSNENFLQNPLGPQGLMVLTSSPETSRVSKDNFQVPPAVMSTAGPFGHPLYPHGFLRPGVDPRAFGISAEKMGLGNSHHSAFSPAKRPRLGRDSPPEDHQKHALDCTKGSKHHSPAHSPLYRPYASNDDSYNSTSPASTGRTSPNESMDEEPKRDTSFSSENKRNSGKMVIEAVLPGSCPVCGIKLDKASFTEHVSMELQKLEASIRSDSCSTTENSEDLEKCVPSTSSQRESLSPKYSSTSRYQTYLRIKGNRQSRFNVKYGKMTRRKFEMSQASSTEITGTGHFNQDTCHNSVPYPSNAEPQAEHQEFSRVTSDGEEEEVDVGWDEPPCLTPNTSSTSTTVTTDDDDRHSTKHSSPQDTSSRLEPEVSSEKPQSNGCDSKTCGICQRPYKDAVASLLCWHVFCHCCWLQSLDKEKCCPQCKGTTTTADLRRVYV